MSIFKRNSNNITVTKSHITDNSLRLYDDGNGGLITAKGVRIDGASVDYRTGDIRIPKNPLRANIQVHKYNEFALQTDAPTYQAVVSESGETVTEVAVIAPTNALAEWVSAPETRTIAETISQGAHVFDVLAGIPFPRSGVLNSWRFDVAGEVIIERDGVLYKNFNNTTGEGERVGSFNPFSGQVKVEGIAPDQTPEIRVLSGVYMVGDYQVKQFYGHTAAAPLKPRSLTVYADVDGKTLIGQSQANGSITGDLTGKVDYETGYYEVAADKPLPPESVRYNAVSQAYIPLDGKITGINAVRLPADGRVPVFRAGDTILISNKLKHDLGNAHTSGKTVSLPRQNNQRICVLDADGQHVLADKYSVDLAAGSLTWAANLDLAGYKMPLTACCVWEEHNRIRATDISGEIKLQNALSRDWPQENTHVSSAVLGGDLQVRATEPFAQDAWRGRWQEVREGDALLSRVNVKDYPMALTADGAITERWLIRFKSDTQFDLFGEQLGLVLQSDTLNDLAPVNPATGKPYFTLPHLAFGGGWRAGNCIRFNTSGTILAVWLLRVVQPSTEKQAENDGVTVCLRGNTEILNKE
ncbi:hypothetical protein [Conchiformibius steedae]|uniref:hypothetical protein n=1 Tax=Conchiformibius steedae TaxID=153493 RepID=UPI0021AB979A|nr:hypothetical protein [Conchiformibius steedae]